MSELVEDLGGQYHFHVGREYFSHSADYTEYGYGVHLPHSCDEWQIADAATKAEAIAQMETFIAEAQAALAKLKELP